jgi:SNF2 family DNA or RNA helicase
MTQVTVDLVPPAAIARQVRHLQLEGGDPKGNDGLHKLVSSWAGWRRRPGFTSGGSIYQARAWLAALQPLLASQTTAGGALTIAWTPEARAWADAQAAAYRRRELALTGKVAAEEPARWLAAGDGRPPMVHQVQALRALSEMGGAALLTDDMGLGKTATALLTWAASECMRALVICPKSVKLNWEEECEMAFGSSFGVGEPLCYVIDGTPSQRANVIGFMRAAIAENRQAIAIVNYDLLRSMNEIAWTTLEQFVGMQCLIADEFHYCKDLDSKRTKSVQALMNLASLRLGLTGTPVRNTVEDLFALIELLRPGTWVSYHDFANRHLVISQAQFLEGRRKVNVVRGGKNLDELARVVSTLRIGRKKEDVLTLPPLIRTKPKLELDGLHLDVYKAMKNFARVELEKLIATPAQDKVAELGVNVGDWPKQIDDGFGRLGDVSIFHPLARSAVEAAMRCEMIAQGFLSGLPEQYAQDIAPLIAGKAERVDGYPNAFVFPDSPKLAWLLDVVENDLKDRQVVIFSRFNAPILWLKKRLTAGVLIGSMDAVARQEAIASFRKGEQRVLCVQVKMAEGFNLTNATEELFLGRDWSPSINWQAEARCHRIGTAGTVNVQIPIVHKTVEVFIDKKLAAKDADAQQALAKVTLRELLEAL